MRVVHLFGAGGEAYGRERSVLVRLRGLASAGVEFRAVVISETRAGGLGARTEARLKELGRPYDVIPTDRRLPFGVARRVQGILDKFVPDVLSSHGYKSDVVSMLVRTGAVRVTTVHGWCGRSLRERAYEWVGLQCQKMMDLIVVFSEDYRQRLLRCGVRRDLMRVIPTGIDASAMGSGGRDFRTEWRAGRSVVIAQVGRLSPEKNPALFIEAARRLCARFPDVQFVLAGEGAQRQEMEARAADLGGRVRLVGYVSPPADIYRAADIVVVSSTVEAIPGVLLEAGACGVPCVATAVGGVPEVVEDGVTGLLCPSGDAAAMESALARLIEDAELRRKMGAAARERVTRRFSAEAYSRELVDAYRAVLRRKGGGGR